MRRLLLLGAICALSLSAETRLGKPFELKQAVPVATVAANPADYVGKAVQVKGKVSEVCQKAGCWMMLVDPSSNLSVRIKVKDGEIVFPTAAVGKLAIAEGKMVKIEMTRDQLVAQMKHEAEENGKKFDPESVKAGKTVYQIAGTGAVVLD